MNSSRTTQIPETSDVSRASAAMVSARLDRLPATSYIWKLIVLLSLGGFFDVLGVALTASISPGLIRAGFFHAGVKGLFGFTDQATFAAATFFGLFIGTIAFASVADRFGRRAIFTMSLLWYAAATVVMASQNNAVAIDLWRFIGRICLGGELGTIERHISELGSQQNPGRALSVNHHVQATARFL